MTKHLKITIEADDQTEPIVFEGDAETYRFERSNQFATLEQDDKKYYALAGASVRIDWSVNPVWDFKK